MKSTTSHTMFRHSSFSSASRIMIILGIFVLSTLVCGALYYTYSHRREAETSHLCTTHHDIYTVMRYRLVDQDYDLLVADTSAKQEYGLMNVKSKADICGYDGMIFVYKVPQIYTFWNKNTLVDLELTWQNKTSGYESRAQLPNITDHGMVSVSPQAPVDTVIEIIKSQDKDEKVTGIVKKTCVVGGCSGQLCTEPDAGGGGVVSTCEWREIYACYQDARCTYDERTQSCQWVLDDKLRQCLSAQEKPPL